MHLVILFIVFYGISIIRCVEVDFTLENEISEGENRYRELIKKSYGDCWKDSLFKLHSGCKNLNEEIQSRLALSFTNCFLEHTGSKPCSCPDETKISDCLGNSSDRVFSTYTEFFTHTQSICHYLQHKMWQEETEKTVVMLTETSESISQKLDQSSKSQSKLLDLQQISLQEQQRLITTNHELNSELHKSREHAKSVFDDFKSTTNEQRLLMFEVFDRIKGLQNLVLGEFTSAYTIAYYIGGVFLIYILTSIPSTSDARIWLLLLISINAIAERFLASYNLDEEMSKLFPLSANGPLYTKIWTCRKIICSLGIITLLYFHHCYKDFNAINNQLLREIQRQNSDIQEYIKNIKQGHVTQVTMGVSTLEAMGLPVSKIVTDVTSVTEISPKIKTPIQKDDSLVSSHHGSSKTTEVSSKKTKALSVVRTPVNQKKTSHLNKNLEDIIALSSLENSTEPDSPNRRYNLRSRVNSPTQSPSDTAFDQSSLAAVTKHLEARSPVVRV